MEIPTRWWDIWTDNRMKDKRKAVSGKRRFFRARRGDNLKRLVLVLCCFAVFLVMRPVTIWADGNGNMDGGGGGMGQGTVQNKWSPGNDGVRITVVDADSGAAVSAPIDFSNREQSGRILHFGKVNKLQYRGGTGLSMQSGGYSCIKPENSMPAIVSSMGRNQIEAVKRYFCSEYACRMVARYAGADYDAMLSGAYKLLIEPIAYFTHNGKYYAMTATEAALYDQQSGGALRRAMPSLTHKNLPLSMFLEESDLGIGAWSGSVSGKQSNEDIIAYLGAGIVWFDKKREPEGEIEAPDVEYRVDTDVITAIKLETKERLTPDNPATVVFHILGTDYRVENVVAPANESQLVWVKWHTPSEPQDFTITVTVDEGFTAKDIFTAKIVDLNENPPPDPLATDTSPGYTVPPLPAEEQKTEAAWGLWSCYWEPKWVWQEDWQWQADACTSTCPENCSGGHGHWEDMGKWVDEGDWKYEHTEYSASLSGHMTLEPDDTVPAADGKVMKSGYGVKTRVEAALSTDAPDRDVAGPQTAFTVFPEFDYDTYWRLLEGTVNGRSTAFEFQLNEYSTYQRAVHFTPVWFPDAADYTAYTRVWDAWTPDGMLSVNLNDYVTINQNLYDDWYTNRE